MNNELIGDDRDFIENWQSIRSVNNIPALIGGDLPEVHQGTYRPVRSLLYLIYYQLFATQAWGYHLHAMLVHTGISVLIFVIGLKLQKSTFVAGSASVLFASHPIHLEAVTFITASLDTTAFLFLLTVLWLHLQNRFKLSYVLTLLAFLTNETAYVLPILLSLYYWYRGKTIKEILKYTKIYWLLLGAVVLFRFGVIGVGSRSEYLGGSFWYAQLVSLKALGHYVYVLLFPYRVGLIHILPGGISNYMFQDVVSEVIRQQKILEPILLLITSLLALSLSAIWKYRNHFFWFGVGWFLVSLLPVLNLIPTAVSFTERYAYLASVGFVWSLSWIIWQSRHFHRYVPYLFLVIVAMFYTVSSLYYQQFWQNEIVYWEKNVSDSPENFLAHYQLGQVYHRRAKFNQAKQSYQQAIRLQPEYINSYLQLGIIYQYLGEYPQALNAYNQVLEKYPQGEVPLQKKVEVIQVYVPQLIEAKDYQQANLLLDQANNIIGDTNQLLLLETQLCKASPQVCESE